MRLILDGNIMYPVIIPSNITRSHRSRVIIPKDSLIKLLENFKKKIKSLINLFKKKFNKKKYMVNNAKITLKKRSANKNFKY